MKKIINTIEKYNNIMYIMKYYIIDVYNKIHNKMCVL